MFNFTQDDLRAAADQLEAAIKAGVAETFADFYMAQDKRGNWYQCPALICAVRINPELAEIVRTKPFVRLLDILTAEQSNQIEDIQANFAYEFTRDNHKSYTGMFEYSPQLILNWLRQKIAEVASDSGVPKQSTCNP